MAQWNQAWSRLGWKIADMRRDIGLYKGWVRPFFETNLHFMAYLTP